MQKVGSTLGLLVVFLLSASVASAEGDAQASAIKALEAAARGDCPESLMSPALLDACESQQPQLGQMLKGFGAIKSADYRGLQHMPNGVSAEAYKVQFASGSMLWLASLGPDGKLVVLLGGGQFRPN